MIFQPDAYAKKAYLRGKEASSNGKTLDDNPFLLSNKGLHLASWWDKGFTEVNQGLQPEVSE